jgi:hypothetical protein
MKKILISLFLLLAVTSSMFAAILFFIDYDKIFKEFLSTSKISEDSAKTVKYKVVKFPFPHLVTEGVSEKGKIDIKHIEIHFSLLSLLKLDPKVTNLKAKEAVIYLTHDDVNFITHDEFISELINKGYLTLKVNIDKLIFIESDKDVALEISNFSFDGTNNSEQFSGLVDGVGNLAGAFKRSDDKNKDQVAFDLIVQGSGFKVLLKENYEKGVFESGAAEIYSNNLPNKIGKLFPDISAISRNLNSDEEVKITFDMSPMQRWINLKNITVDSPSLQGKGEIALSKDINDVNDIKFDFTKIDLDSWKKSDSSATNQIPVNYGNKAKFDFDKNKLKADVKVLQLQLNSNYVLRDVEFACYVENGKLRIDEFSGKINKHGSFKISGEATQNSFRSLFEGKVELRQTDLNNAVELIAGKEFRTETKIPYTLTSDIKMSSVDLSMQNIVLKTPSTEINGNISTKFIGNSPRTNATLKFSAINATDKSFPGLLQIHDYLSSLTDNMKSDDYLNKFIPLRKISSSSNYSISFDKLTVNDTVYDHVNFNLGMAPGHLRINNLYLNNGTDYVDADVDIVASGVKPVISIKISDGSLKVNFLKPESMLDMKKKILAEYALDKISLNMDFNLSKIYQDNFELTNVIFRAKSNNILLDIGKFETDLFKGRFISAGSILLDPYTITLVYALNSANVESITDLLPDGLIKSGGAISASGMISTNGNKINELLYNLYTKSLIITKDITIRNFSIDNLIQKLTTKNYNPANFKDDVKASLLTGDTQIDDLKSSDVELSKGLIKMPAITFKTKYTSGTATANINIYDFSLNLNSIFSFFLAKQTKGKNIVDYSPSKITVTATGTIFSPKKEAVTKDFEELLNTQINIPKKTQTNTPKKK